LSIAPRHHFALNYDKFLGPLFFEPYAEDLVKRIKGKPAKMLELACGTGILTTHLTSLPWTKEIVATDKEESMLQVAAMKLKNVDAALQLADSHHLPFKDHEFELVICQFGFMFFQEKDKAFSEAFRLLSPGGQLLFNVWDEIKFNDISFLTDQVIAALTGKPSDQRKGPYSFFDTSLIVSLVKQAGFINITSETILNEVVDPDPENIYKGLILGSPLAAYFQSSGIPESVVKHEVYERFRHPSGINTQTYTMQAKVFAATKPF
jgi:ubiquinone/menaquinone biosynthesis C-methylase UbiE